MAWVTTSAQRAGAGVRVQLRARRITGTTDASGIVGRSTASAAGASCNGPNEYDGGAWFVSARAKDDKGIEDPPSPGATGSAHRALRFNVPTIQPESDQTPTPSFERTPLRAGET